MKGKTLFLSTMLLAAVTGVGLLATAEPARATSPGENGKIVFVSYRDSTSDGDIYAMNPDGTGLIRLTNGPAYEDDPTWSPDGTKIAFRSDYRIFVMNADGTGQVGLTSGPGQDSHPAWSPDGSKIAFVRYENGSDSEIYMMNADGSGVRRLTDDAVNDEAPSWSPDGSKIAFSSSDGNKPGIFTMNPDGTNKTRLTTTWERSMASDEDPDWSPDGSKIVFERTAYRVNGEIHAVNADGSGETRLASNTYYNAHPRWSPDGQKIVYAGPAGGSGSYYNSNDYEIYTMNADGTGQADITNNPANDLSPDWGSAPAASQSPSQANWGSTPAASQPPSQTNPPDKGKHKGKHKRKGKRAAATRGEGAKGGK